MNDTRLPAAKVESLPPDSQPAPEPPPARAVHCPQCAALTDTLAHDPAKGWKCPKCSQGGKRCEN